MSIEMKVAIAAAIVGAITLLIVFWFVYKKLPKRLKHNKFIKEWRQLQDLCRHRESWPEALESADRLLDKALKTRNFKGKTMGERIVAAQRKIEDNDGIWFAHNLAKKLREADNKPSLHERDVKRALVAFRSALKDLGAF